MKNIIGNLSEAVQNGDKEQAVKLVEEALKSKILAIDILSNGLVPGIQAVGKLFKDGQAFLPEVLISVRAMKAGVELIQPYISAADMRKKGTVVLGTVEGDIHDLGKNLVKMMLESSFFDVVDLGVDVTADSFIDATRENKADIVAMSGLLTTTIPYFSTVIQALKEAGLRDKVKVMIGGAPVSQAYADEIGADGYATDCVSAIDEASHLLMKL